MTIEKAAASGAERDPAAAVGVGAGGSAAMAELMKAKMTMIAAMRETCIAFAIDLLLVKFWLRERERERERGEIWRGFGRVGSDGEGRGGFKGWEPGNKEGKFTEKCCFCLLYTSDAADE